MGENSKSSLINIASLLSEQERECLDGALTLVVQHFAAKDAPVARLEILHSSSIEFVHRTGPLWLNATFDLFKDVTVSVSSSEFNSNPSVTIHGELQFKER